MPKYDFLCSACGMTVEYEKAYGDDSLPICCQSGSMTRLWTTTPVHFKGSGYYSTDNKK